MKHKRQVENNLSFRKLSFVVDYNQADAFAGHNQFFEGLTLFHASADEKTLGSSSIKCFTCNDMIKIKQDRFQYRPVKLQ